MSAPYDRPANEPGGCECFDCGVIFIGAEWHTQCAVPGTAKTPQGAEGEAGQPGADRHAPDPLPPSNPEIPNG